MSIHLSSLRAQALPELVREAQESGIDNAGNLQASELVFELIRLHSTRTDTIIGDGFLEVLPDGFGFLRSSVSHFAPGVDDIYVSPSQIRRFNLRSGDWVEGKIRVPREGERYLALLQIHSVSGVKPDKARNRLRFSSLETTPEAKSLAWRSGSSVDTFSNALTFGFGDRVLFHCPSNSGHFKFIQSLVKSIDATPVVALIGGTPMELAQFQKSYDGEFFYSNTGGSAERHVQAAEFALLRAKRIAEQQKDVLVILSSVDRIMRAYRDTAETSGHDGSFSLASANVRRLLGNAQALKGGGSISTLGLISDMDNPIDLRLKEDIDAETFVHLSVDYPSEDSSTFRVQAYKR